MLGRDIITKIISEDGLSKEYVFTEKNIVFTPAIQRKEPKSLSEIADVTFEYGRLILNVRDPFAARKFSLKDNVQKYEFDGGTMYFYKDRFAAHSYSYNCGNGTWTIVSNSDKDCIRSVKEEMVKQIIDKRISCPKSIIYDLPFSPLSISYFTWCK